MSKRSSPKRRADVMGWKENIRIDKDVKQPVAEYDSRRFRRLACADVLMFDVWGR
jgi:hypothetical protein